MNIEQVLGLVLELEEQSKEIVKQASEYSEALPARIEEQLAKIRNKYTADAQKRIGLIRTEEAERLGKELAEVDKSHEAEMQWLLDAADRETENWADRIFKNVVYSEQG